MIDNNIHFRTVSQCINSDWCEGYNEAAKKANEIIDGKNAEIKALKAWHESMNEAIVARNAEIKRLQESKISFVKTFPARCNGKQFGMYIALYKAGVEDFAEEFENRCIASGVYPAVTRSILKKLVKELTEVKDDEN